MDDSKLRVLIREMLSEMIEEFLHPFHIIVLFDKKEKDNLELLTEGKWVPSGVNDYWQRLDKPKFDFEQLHVHIAHQKHIDVKNKQVAWNYDKTKHDKKSFNNNFNGIETAKKIAKKALGLPANAVLENIKNKRAGLLLLESVEYLPKNSSIFIFQVMSKKKKVLLFS
jgi:hypothetical protein